MKTKQTFLSKALFLSFISLATLSCEDDVPLPETTFYGPAVQLGNGNLRSFVQNDASGRSKTLGVVFPESALSGLSDEMQHLQLQLPRQLSDTPFDHIGFDWNPEGHEPPGVYDLPHFDIHFYMISSAERMQIGANDPLSEKLPEAKYMPASYIALPGSVPMMGKHWIDPASPELHGEVFTQTFLMGSYNEEVTFYEPMITVDYLEEKLTEEFDLPLPLDYQQKGKYHPTGYSISYNPVKKEYTVSLTGLTKK